MRQVIIDGVEYIPKKQIKSLLADAKVGDLCQRRDGKWVQIETLCSLGGMPWICYEIGGLRYINNGEQLNTKDRNLDIISTEPLAPEGSAEWAWQTLMLFRAVSHPAEGIFHDTYYTKEGFIRCMAKTGWQLYEPEPEPKPEHPAINGYNRYDYIPVEGIRQPKPEPEPEPAVGDWVELTDGQQCCLTECLNPNSGHWLAKKVDDSKLSVWEKNSIRTISRTIPKSEVKVTLPLTLEGTVTNITNNTESFLMWHGENSDKHAEIIRYADLDPATAKLVRELVAKQEEK